MQIRETKKMGRGVFATQNYSVGETIEKCPIIRFNASDRKVIDKTNLYNYYFEWGEKSDEGAVALGYGSLYNHCYKPNAKYIKVLDKDIIIFLAHTDIKAGDEIKVNYNEDPFSIVPLWFTAID